MASDVRDVTDKDEEGRLRGFDNANDDSEYENDSFEDELSDGEQNEVTKLKQEVDRQAATIKELQKELAKTRDFDEAILQNQTKKRKIGAEKTVDTISTTEYSDKDKIIKELTDKVQDLEKQLNNKKGLQAAEKKKPNVEKPEVEDKSTEAKPQRVLPLPNASTLIEELQSSIEDRFLKMQDAIGKFIEEKMESKLKTSTPVTAAQAQPITSYANATSNSSQVRNFREIVAAAKNEELAEEREKNFRLNNIIIHGSGEACGDDQSMKDEVFFNKLITDLSIGAVQAKSIVRLGQKNEGKKRPIKIILSNVLDKEKIMNNLSNLKDKGYNGISITEDHTITERKMIKDFVDQAKLSNENESPDSDKFWVVRGSPKNGLFLKKVTKSTRSQTLAQSQ